MLAPARLCLRRRCRACRDIPGASRLPLPDCDFLPVAPSSPSSARCTSHELRHSRARDRRRRGRADRLVRARASPRGGRSRRARCAGACRRALACGLRADPARMAAVRDSWRALWSSRLLVWAAVIGTLAGVRLRPGAQRLQPARGDAAASAGSATCSPRRRRAGTRPGTW